MATLGIKRQYWGFIIAALLGALFALIPDVNAAFLPLPDTTDLNVPTTEGDTGVQRLESILGPIGRVIRIMTGAVAVLLIVISGFTMTISGDNEETIKKQKQSIVFAIIGLMMISIAGPIAEVFDFRAGNFLDSPESLVERAALFDDTTRVIVTFVKYLLGAVATLMFIISGARMIVGSANEENVSLAKKNMALGASGLILVLVSDLIVRRIFYDAEYNEAASETIIQINQNELVSQVVGFTNLLVTFVGPIFMLGIVGAGVLYVTAGGDEERTNLAKKVLINSIIGVAIIYGAFAIVSTVITGVF